MRLVMEIGKKYENITGPMSDAFAQEITEASTGSDFDTMILDLSGTKIISSMAMGSIFSVYQKLQERGKNLRIINASDKVTHLLEMVNMSDLLA